MLQLSLSIVIGRKRRSGELFSKPLQGFVRAREATFSNNDYKKNPVLLSCWNPNIPILNVLAWFMSVLYQYGLYSCIDIAALRIRIRLLKGRIRIRSKEKALPVRVTEMRRWYQIFWSDPGFFGNSISGSEYISGSVPVWVINYFSLFL